MREKSERRRDLYVLLYIVDLQEKVNHIVTPVKHKERRRKEQRQESLFSQPGKFKNGVLYVDPKLLGK